MNNIIADLYSLRSDKAMSSITVSSTRRQEILDEIGHTTITTSVLPQDSQHFWLIGQVWGIAIYESKNLGDDVMCVRYCDGTTGMIVVEGKEE